MTSSARILVVDDEPGIRDMLADFLGMEGYSVTVAEDGPTALVELAKGSYDLILSDLKMPGMDGIALLKEVALRAPSSIVILMTGFGTVETALEAMKRGAYDYLLKPFKLDEVAQVVARALERGRMLAENMRLREAVSLYKVSEAIAHSLSLDEVMITIGKACIDELSADLVSTWLFDDGSDDPSGQLFEKQHLWRAFEPDQTPLPVPHNITLASGTIIHHLETEPLLLEHGSSACRFATSDSTKIESILSVPLRMSKGLIGFIAVVSLSHGKRFNEGQRKMLMVVGDRAASSIENARLYEDLRSTFQQTISGLAAAIDKMDHYTSGHSDRVAEYAVFLANKLNLPAADVEVVRQSALMHDIGKIGCVMNLNKPGKLTDDEYAMFTKHPGYGKEILHPIRFLHPLIPGVYSHHERWDGRGYPDKMDKTHIPLIARIISVADTYDAMTSDRAYRRALPHEVSIGEIERCAGSQFDPDISKIFTETLDEHREQMRAAGKSVPE